MKLESTTKTLTVREALNYVMKGICGSNAVSRIQEAEGLALTGRRCSCLVSAEPSMVPITLETVDKAFVYANPIAKSPGIPLPSSTVSVILEAFLRSEVEKRPVPISLEGVDLNRVITCSLPTQVGFENFIELLESEKLPKEAKIAETVQGMQLSAEDVGSWATQGTRYIAAAEAGNSQFSRNGLRLAAHALTKQSPNGLTLEPHPERHQIWSVTALDSESAEDGLTPILFAKDPSQVRQNQALDLLAEGGVLVLNQVAADGDQGRTLFLPVELDRLKSANQKVVVIESDQWHDMETALKSIWSMWQSKGTIQSDLTLDLDGLKPLDRRGNPVLPTQDEPTPIDQKAWQFHVLGNTDLDPESTKLAFDSSIQSLSLETLVKAESEGSHYPLVILPGFEIVTLKGLMQEKLEELGNQAEILAAHRDFFIFSVLEFLREEEKTIELEDGLRAGLKYFLTKLEVSEAGRTALNQELDLFFDTIPKSALLLGMGQHTCLELYIYMLHKKRGASISAYRAEAEKLIRKLQDILSVQSNLERDRSTSSANRMGAMGSTLFKSDTPTPQTKSGSRELSPERKSRILKTIDTLKHFAKESKMGPQVHLVHRDALPNVEFPEQVTVYSHQSPLDVAHGMFKGLAEEMTKLALSMRIARLEASHAFDEKTHGDMVQRFNLSAFTEEDWSIFPIICVLDQADRVKQSGMNGFSNLLCSSLPVHILLTENPWENLLKHPETERRIHRDLGYLAMSHKDAFVLRSSMARPAHLVEGFERMATLQAPALAIISASDPTEAVFSWTSLFAFLSGRAANLYRYDPSAGATWAERFDISGSPATSADWPTFSAICELASGDEETLDTSFTFADAVSMLTNYRNHFMVLEPSQWSENQIYLADYLNDSEKMFGKFVPYIWVIDSTRTLRRALVSRELTRRCQSRLDLWNTLAELGGIDNSHALLASEQVRQAAETAFKAELDALRTQHEEELEHVKSDTARDALGQLARVLVEMDPGQELNLVGSSPSPTSAQATSPTTPEPSSTPEPEPAQAEHPTPEAEEDAITEDPYVDTELCTSCNECVTMNPQLFIYNSDKQVELGDPATGTFLQLVSAAEKCPSRCIHPGSPRPGDSTATEELIAKAAKFN